MTTGLILHRPCATGILQAPAARYPAAEIIPQCVKMTALQAFGIKLALTAASRVLVLMKVDLGSIRAALSRLDGTLIGWTVRSPRGADRAAGLSLAADIQTFSAPA